MHRIEKLIRQYKEASDALQHALNYDENGEEYKGNEELRERVESFCLSYDEHIILRRLGDKFNE
ncbi:hypothetical protein MOD25_05600 [Bacillus haynesii]|uniref:hypothetical protein n=1 Tax=Bacillus haynesii TaxID=1925021 RepID=UPI00227F8C5A|nr:hypothetical protein [Bacillus haynesii]MCY8549376.1 hypothetical protein [Bacillus haynesii]